MINTREIAEEYRLSHWAQVMQKRTVSGLSIKAFCEREGFQENRYFYWQRKLREAATEQLAVQTLPPKGWMQADAVEEKQKIDCGLLPIEVGRCRMIVDHNTDPELLAKVCQVLISLC